MNVNWLNPYEGTEGFHLKGSLHTHTPNPKSGCGSVPMEELVGIYEKMGYSFMAVTNHNIVTDVSGAGNKKFTVLPGIEVDMSGKYHFGIVHSDAASIFHDPAISQQEMIDRNISAGALVTLHHPDWQQVEHYTCDELMKLRGYDGIEIYNSVIEFLEGSPLSTAKWDRLLSSGRQVLGFANQDFHNYPNALDCCNAVSGRDNSPKGLLSALKSGRFYCHYGVVIKSLGRNGNIVNVATENARLIRFIGLGGRVLGKVRNSSAQIEFKQDPEYSYIRIECLGEGEEISFSQPFFRAR